MTMLQAFSTESDVSIQEFLVLYNPQIFCDYLNTENSLISPWKSAQTHYWEKEKKEKL